VCRRIARWIARSAAQNPAKTNIVERPIGDDLQALRQLNPNLDIWDTYATLHVLMPDASIFHEGTLLVPGLF
jgi:glucose-6-phosphate 1-dehydrogenase